MYKSNVLRTLGLEAKAKNGNNPPTLKMKANYAVFQQTQDLIERLGYREVPKDKYEEWVKSVEAEKVKLSK